MGAHFRTIPTTAVDQAEARPTPFSSSPVSTCDLLRSFTARAATDTAGEGQNANVPHPSPTEKEGRKLKRHSLLQPKQEYHPTHSGTAHESDDDDDDEFVDASPTHLDVLTPVTTELEPSGAPLLSPIPGSASFDTPYGWHEPPASPSPTHPPTRLLEVDYWEAAYPTPSRDPPASSIARSTSRSTARPRFSSVSKSKDGKTSAIKFKDRPTAGDLSPESSPVTVTLPIENSVKLRLRAQLAAKGAANKASSGSSVKSNHIASTKSVHYASMVEGASKSGPALSVPIETLERQDILAAPSPETPSTTEDKDEDKESRPSNEEVLAKMRAANAAAGRHGGSTPTTPTREASTGRKDFESPKTPSMATRTISVTNLSPIYTGPPSVKSESVKRETIPVPAQSLARSTGSPARSVMSTRSELIPQAALSSSNTTSHITSERDRKVARDIARLLGDDPVLVDGLSPTSTRSTQGRDASMTESQRIRQEYQSSRGSTSDHLDKPSSGLVGDKATNGVSKKPSREETPRAATDPPSTALPVLPALSPLPTSWSQNLFSATGRPSAGVGVTANSPRGSQAQSRSPSPAKRAISPELAIRMSCFEALSTPLPASPVRGSGSSTKTLKKTVGPSPRATPIVSSGANVSKDSPRLRRQEAPNSVPPQSEIPLEGGENPSKIDPSFLSSQDSPTKSVDGGKVSARVGSAKIVNASPGSVKSTSSSIIKVKSCAYQATPFIGKDDVFGGSQKSYKHELIEAPASSASPHEVSVIAPLVAGKERPESLGSMKPLTGSICRRSGSCSDLSYLSRAVVSRNRGLRSNSGSTGATGVLPCTSSEVERILHGENAQQEAPPANKVDGSRVTHVDAFGRRLLPFEQRKMVDDDDQTMTTRHAMETPADRLAWNKAKEAYSNEARNFRAYEACMNPLGTVRSARDGRSARISRSKSTDLDQDLLDRLPKTSLLPVKDRKTEQFKDTKTKETSPAKFSTTPIKIPVSPLCGINAVRDNTPVKTMSKSSEAFGSNWSLQPSPSETNPVTPSRIIGRGQRGQHDARPLVTRMGDFVAADRAIHDKSSPMQPVLVNEGAARNVTTPYRKQDATGSPKVTWGSPVENAFDRTPAMRSDPLAPNPVNAFLENDRKLVENAKARAKEIASMPAGGPTPPRATVERKKFWGQSSS